MSHLFSCSLKTRLSVATSFTEAYLELRLKVLIAEFRQKLIECTIDYRAFLPTYLGNYVRYFPYSLRLESDSWRNARVVEHFSSF